MLRRLGIRAKVLAVLAVPMAVLLAAGAYISYGAIQDLRYARATQTVVRALDALSPLTAAFQQERILSLTFASPEQVEEARRATDQALADVRKVTEQLDLSAFPVTVVRDFRAQQQSYRTALPQLRERIDGDGQRIVIKNGFRDILEGQTRVMEGVATSLRDRDLAQYIAANREMALLSDALVNEYVTGIELKNADADSPALARSFQSQTTTTELARERARLAVDGLGVEGLALGTGDPTAPLLSMRALFTSGAVSSIETVNLESWAEQTTNQMTALGTVNSRVLAGADEVAASGVSEARDTALITVALAVLALVVSFFLAITVARSIVVPLRRLTSAAADVREQLPRLVEQVATPGEGPEITLTPIPVSSEDEVGRLADAFNAVNATTVQVAQEQAALRGSIAEMFVNVARRDQVLLNRQLSFIDSLERAEEDPGTLANLFRLDHLATRMRRNAESLLVLAGIDSGRRLRDAMPLSDVIRTASSEIEQYDRVELDLQVDPHMLGFNALSAAHLLAELLENATVFSEPETPVVVSTGISGGNVVVRIQDQGLGMTDAEIEAANHKIASVSASDALGAQRLGLFVVGRLTQRLGAEVVLRKRVGGTGTEAYVSFPNTLFSANEVGSYGALPPAAPATQSAGVPEVEAPVVEPVNLAELTDGETSLGLPRRRRGDDTGAAPTAPAAAPAPAGDDPIPVPMLGGEQAPLPSRSRKTFDEDNLVLPMAPEPTTLAPELSVDTGEWAPAIQAAPANSGLPTRSRAATPAWAEPEPEETTPAPAPADPTARMGLFSGFRSGRDVAAAASENAPALESDEATRDRSTLGAERPAWPTPAWREADAEQPAAQAAEPAQDEASEETSAWDAPQEPSWTPPAAEERPWAPTLVEDEPQQDAAQAWAAATQDPAPVEPAWGEQPASAQWAEEAPAAQWAEQEQAPAASWDQQEQAPAASWDQQEQATSESWEQQAPAATWDDWQQPTEEQAPAQESGPTFPAYSGYSGWAGSSDSPALQYTAPYVPFERSLDEARAWHTGAIPTVPEPVRREEPVWSAPAAVQVEPDPEPEAEEEVEGPWAPVAAVQAPAFETPAFEAPAEPAPSWQSQAAPAVQEAPAAPAQEDWRPATPAWARSVAAEQPTETFAPVQAEPEPVAAPPAWQPTQPAPAAEAPAFTQVVDGDTDGDDKPKRRWGAFFSRKKEADAEVAQESAAPAAAAPVRTSAWSPDAPAPVAPAPQPAAQAPAASTGWEAPTWNAPPPPQSAATPAVPEARPAPSWSPPEWAGRQPAPTSTVPHPSVPPSAAPRVGTLDDEVAAMLALRSDIQEQALSELSQLSAYRPSAVGAGSSERLTKRVPSVVPAAPAPVEERPVERDAEQLRSRLASFQSGTSRGRRAAQGPQDGDHS